MEVHEMTPARRMAVLAVVVVVAVVLFIALKPDDKKTSAPTTAGSQAPAQKKGSGQAPSPPPLRNIRVKGGKPIGGVQDLEFNKGETIKFAVSSDVADEIHVHGYDLMKDVTPGHPVKFSFPGKIDGEFDIELEGRKQQIASLKVTP